MALYFTLLSAHRANGYSGFVEYLFVIGIWSERVRQNTHIYQYGILYTYVRMYFQCSALLYTKRTINL